MNFSGPTCSSNNTPSEPHPPLSVRTEIGFDSEEVVLPAASNAAPVVALIATPKSGVLDSWLPVVEQLRKAHPDWKFVVVFPFARKMSALREDDFVVTDLLREGDALLFVGLDERPYVAKGLRAARRVAIFQHQLQRRLQRLASWPARAWNLCWKRALFRSVTRWAPVVGWAWSRRATSTMHDLRNAVVLYDILGATKHPVPQLLQQHLCGPRFSLCHGLSIQLDESTAETTTWGVSRSQTQEVVYLKSHREVAYYQQRFGLAEFQLRVVGVPRHDPQAMGTLFGSGPGTEGEVARDAVLLLSRPATSNHLHQVKTSDWLPVGLKADSLQLVHNFCRDHDLKLIVSCHPSESEEQVRSALPTNQFGQSWFLSRAHPMQNARRARFAVVFSSGLAAEMVGLGIPVIELQLGKRASPTMQRALGLVLPADDEQEFVARGKAALVDPEGADRLVNAYRRLYADPSGAVAAIAGDIEEAVRAQREEA